MPNQTPQTVLSTEHSISGLSSRRAAWRWVPSLYFAEGIPYIVVIVVAGIMYKRLGISNTEIALYTSWLYLPWVIKPFWSPLVDILKSKRWWIVIMQLMIGAGLAGVALTIPTSDFLRYTLAFLWLLAFSSATHDIAADGFYMLALSANNQAWFVGIRSTFYRFAMIAGQGVLVMFAGFLESVTGLPVTTIEVRAISSSDAIQNFDPGVVRIPGQEGDLQLHFHAPVLDIGRIPKTSEEVQKTIDQVRQWNIEHGYYPDQEPKNTEASGPAKKADWLISIEQWIRKHFGPVDIVGKSHESAGNIGIIYMTLTGTFPPDKELAVQFERMAGDKNIRIKEGERFTVNASNHRAPMAAIVQIDPKLAQDCSTRFSATSGNSTLAWTTTFYLAAALFLVFFAYHAFALPHPAGDTTPRGNRRVRLAAEFVKTFATFFRKKHILAGIVFLLLYRFAESQLVKIAPLFLLDTEGKGGLALTTSEVGFVYGTVGVLALMIGGILGGLLASRQGLKFWIWWMALAINLPNLVYVVLSIIKPDNILWIHGAVAIEQFGYGFGFTAYMLYMLYIAQGEHETAHFAICTGFMALGMMLPGATSGWLQELIGYRHFFIWILIATLPSFLVTYLIPVDPEFGKKNTQGELGGDR